MKKSILFLLFLFTFNSYCWIIGEKRKEEPTGFRGHQWGEEISMLYLREYSRTVPKYSINGTSGKVVYYTKKNENLLIGGAKVEKIEYGYWNDEILIEVLIRVKGEFNFERFKKAVFETFGKGKSYLPDRWVWKGEKTQMKLTYDRNSQTGYLFMSPSFPSKFIQEYEQKIAQKSYSDF